MSENQFVWEVSVNKVGSDEPFDKLTFIGPNFFQISHICANYIFGSEEYDLPGLFDFPVEVTDIKKVKGLGKIINAQDFLDDEEGEEFDLNEPLDLSHANIDNIVEFKCSCTNKVKVNMYDWPAIRCPHCQRIILHRDLSEVAGIWMYTPSNGSGK